MVVVVAVVAVVVAVVVGVVVVVVAVVVVVVVVHGAEVVWALRVVWILRVVKLFHCILAVELSFSPLVVELSLMMVKLFLVGILVHKMMVDFFLDFSLEVSFVRMMMGLSSWVKLFF